MVAMWPIVSLGSILDMTSLVDIGTSSVRSVTAPTPVAALYMTKEAGLQNEHCLLTEAIHDRCVENNMRKAALWNQSLNFEQKMSLIDAIECSLSQCNTNSN